jgi:hypothetical protein
LKKLIRKDYDLATIVDSLCQAFLARNIDKLLVELRGGSRGARAPPLKLEKNKIFWRKIVIFHTKYPKHFRASLRSAQVK